MFIFWSSLPADLQEKVFLCTPVFDLMRCRWACKGMEKIIFNKEFQAKYCDKHGPAPNKFLFEKYLSREHRIYINVDNRARNRAKWPAHPPTYVSMAASTGDPTDEPLIFYRGMDLSAFHIMTVKNPATVRYRSPSPPPPLQTGMPSSSSCLPPPVPAAEDQVQRHRSPSPPALAHRYRSPSPPAPGQRHRSPSPPALGRQYRSPSPPIPEPEERVRRYHSPSPPAPEQRYRSPTPPAPAAEPVWHYRSPSCPPLCNFCYFVPARPTPLVYGLMPRYRAPVQPVPVVEGLMPRYRAPVQPVPVVEGLMPRYRAPVVQPVPLVEGLMPRYRAPVQPVPVVEGLMPRHRAPAQPGPVVAERVHRKRKPEMGPAQKDGVHLTKPPVYETHPHLYNSSYQSVFKSKAPFEIINLSDSDDDE